MSEQTVVVSVVSEPDWTQIGSEPDPTFLIVFTVTVKSEVPQGPADLREPDLTRRATTAVLMEVERRAGANR